MPNIDDLYGVVCEHGSLKRKCADCEAHSLSEELTKAEAELARLRPVAVAAEGWVDALESDAPNAEELESSAELVLLRAVYEMRGRFPVK